MYLYNKSKYAVVIDYNGIKKQLKPKEYIKIKPTDDYVIPEEFIKILEKLPKKETKEETKKETKDSKRKVNSSKSNKEK